MIFHKRFSVFSLCPSTMSLESMLDPEKKQRILKVWVKQNTTLKMQWIRIKNTTYLNCLRNLILYSWQFSLTYSNLAGALNMFIICCDKQRSNTLLFILDSHLHNKYFPFLFCFSPFHIFGFDSLSAQIFKKHKKRHCFELWEFCDGDCATKKNNDYDL